MPIQKETRPPTSFDESDLEATQGIEDFCSAIAGTTGESLTVCIGTLADEWHCIRPPRPASSSPYLQKTVSLHDLLIPGCLEKKVRLQLGVELASAVMQFHMTEWLNESWSNQDISFLQKSRNLPGGIEISEPVADKPIVRRIFGQPKSAPLAEPELFQYDKSLFSLGIVLIELWCERRIDELREPSQTSIPFNDSAVYDTAQRLVGDIFSTAGDLYGLAVSRCLNGLNRPIESTQAERRNLENSKFKNEVQADIISLLERNLEVNLSIRNLEPMLMVVN